MNALRLTTLLIAALSLTACGPDRGLRVEQIGGTARQVDPGTTAGPVHIQAGMTVLSPPYTPTIEGHTIWVGVQFADRNQAIQAVDTDSTQARGIVALPRSVQHDVGLASTPNTIWMLTIEHAGTHSQLQRIGTHVEPARSAALAVLPASADSAAVPEPVFAFPRATTLLGGTNSAVWLLSFGKHGYTLWRCDTRTLHVSRFALASQGAPAVALTPQRVFVVRTTQHRHAVSIETRDASGRVVDESRRIKIDGQFVPGFAALAACGNQIVGSAVRNGSIMAVLLNGTGSPPRYSRSLSVPTKGRPLGAYIAASAFGDHCRSIWVATVSQTYPKPSSGFVTRFDASTLAVTGRIENVEASGLLWADGSLWASDVEHAALLRIG